MDFRFNNQRYSGKEYKKTREDSILDFQYRIFDLIGLSDTPILEKVNFVNIIISNLEEFITTRLQEVHDDRLDNILERIEDLYMKTGMALKEMNEEYHINEIYEDEDFSKRLYHKDMQYVYSGENDVQSNLEMSEITFLKNTSKEFTTLYSGAIPPDDYSVYKIRVPKEIIISDEYTNEYKKKFRNEIFDRSVKYEPISDYYSQLLKEDILIHNPYESYQYVTDFIDQMCKHPEIEIIFITLYRNSKESVIIESLLEARRRDKEVYAYVEPTARGNEQSNLNNICRLKEAGVSVRTNYFNYKVHSKVFCAIDKNNRKFMHIGTGNYNENTAQYYTDTHLMTTNPRITNELLKVLMSLFKKTIYKTSYNNLSVYTSPLNLRPSLNMLIESEIRKHENGRIWIKCNNLYDENIIDKLYQAASAGVDVKIICRTVCGINPKKNLEIRSKVGQYLEHDRIYIFGSRAFISSADLLTRNISKRVEILCEVIQPNKIKLFKIFRDVWNSKNIHQLQENGEWELV